MKTLAKLTFAAIFAAMLAIDASAAATGSCQSKAASLSLGKTVSGNLVDEYDPDYGETTGSAVYYFKLKVSRGDSATILMSGGTTTFDVYEDGDYEGESESSPPWWDDASNPYASEIRLILRAADWDEDAPKSVTYYVVVYGEDIGESFSLQTMSGEVEPVLPQGIDTDTAVLVTPKSTFASVTKSLTEAHPGGYYFKVNLAAGSKYYFGSYDATSETTDVLIGGMDDGTLVPTMTPVEGMVDGTQIAGGTHAGYCVIPSTTAMYYIFVSSGSTNATASVTLQHKVLPSRPVKDHALVKAFGTPGEAAASADISPAYRNNPESGFFDSIIDDALVSATLEKGKKYLFNVDSLSVDTGNLLIELYDAKGTVLASSRKGFLGEGTVGPMLAFEATAAGTYYVGVCQDTTDSTGEESPVAGLSGRISVSQIAEDPFLDEYDLEGTDSNAEVTPVVPAIGEYGEAPEAYDAEGQVHSFGLTDWTDTLSLPVRKGITYSFSVTPETGTFTNGEEEVEVSGDGFAYSGKIYTLSGKTKNVLRTVPDLSAEPLSIQAAANTTYYLEVTKDGQGVPAVYSLHAMASAPNGLGYLTVNIHGPTAEAGAGWYLKGDSTAFKNASGTTMLLPASDSVTVKFTAVKGFSTAADVTGAVLKDETTTFEAYYNDTLDPLDDDPDTKKKEPTLKKAYAPTKLTPSAKGVTASRSLWKVDAADWFTFTATAGTYYRFSLSDIEGDPEVRVYGPNNWTDECDYVLLTNAAEAVQICAEKGTYYVKVAHADENAPEDSAYTLTTVSAVPGVLKLGKTAISVKDTAGYADVSISRTGKDGVVRVKFATEGCQTSAEDAYYYPTNGVLTWAANDNKAQTVRVKLVPNDGWATNKVVNLVFSTFSADDESFDKENEYIPAFVTDKKTGNALDTATITITAAAKKAPGTIQVADCDTPKKPVLTVTAGETIEIPFERVDGSDGVVGVSVETAKGTANKSGETDFVPVVTNLVWEAGETGAKTVSVSTKTIDGDYTAVKTFTLKLKALTSKKTDEVQYDKPKTASASVTVNIANEKFADTVTGYAKANAADLKARGMSLKEGKKDTWFMNEDGSLFTLDSKNKLTFSFTEEGTLTVDGKDYEITKKSKSVTISGVTDIASWTWTPYTDTLEKETLYQGVATEITVTNETITAIKVSGKLPDGLKLAQDKATKVWTISGVPSKAGVYTSVLQTSYKDGSKKVDGEPIPLAYEVVEAGSAIGTFSGLATTSDTTNNLPTLAQVTFTATDNGKLSAKVAIGGKSYSFAATGYSAVVPGDGDTPTKYSAELLQLQKVTVEKSSVTLTNVLSVTVAAVAETNTAAWAMCGEVGIQMAALPDVKGKGFQEDISYSGKVARDNSKIKDKTALAAWQAAVSKYAGYYTVSLVAPGAMSGEPMGSGYMTMTVDAKGKVKVAGMLADGTSYSASSLVAALGTLGDDATITVPLYSCKKTALFGGWLTIRFPADGSNPVAAIDSPDTDLVWKDDDPASTRGGEEGFALCLQPVGGWYDKVSNLQRSYLESDLSVDLPEGVEALDEIMEALALGDDYAFVAQPSGQAVELLGDTFSVEKQKLVKDSSKKLNDWSSSVNATGLKITFKKATGIVNGTFDLWYEGTNAKGATEQKSVKGLKHYGILLTSRGDDGYLEDDVLTSGFFLAPQTLTEEVTTTVGGRTTTKKVSRKWTGSYRFDLKATDVSRTWTDADPE